MPKVHDDTPQKPKLTNRGGAGLYGKFKGKLVLPENQETPKITQATAKYRIAPELQHMAVEIDSLVLDPMNARLHPEKNLDAIKTSLRQYGQVKPLVVRRANNIVIAGNGTLEAAKALGWTEIAANFVDMNEAEAIGYGLADNKTAELAKWDFEVMKRLDNLLQEAGHQNIGWTQSELDVLRAASWIPEDEIERHKKQWKTSNSTLVVYCKSRDEANTLQAELEKREYKCKLAVE